MKRMIHFSVVLLTIMSTVGCACYYPGGRTCGTSHFSNACGPVDYVNGGAGACEASCDEPCGPPCGSVRNSCGNTMGNAPCTDCLVCVGNGIRVIGEGALTIAAAPFVIAGHLICSGCNGYNSPSHCGCSGEVYYGDNCYQPHDFCDPCGASTPCTSTQGSSGCTKCNGGYTEGIQAEPQPLSHQQNTNRNQPANSRTNIKPVSYNARFSQPARGRD